MPRASEVARLRLLPQLSCFSRFTPEHSLARGDIFRTGKHLCNVGCPNSDVRYGQNVTEVPAAVGINPTLFRANVSPGREGVSQKASGAVSRFRGKRTGSVKGLHRAEGTGEAGLTLAILLLFN